jgi:hypothetical protein
MEELVKKVMAIVPEDKEDLVYPNTSNIPTEEIPEIPKERMIAKTYYKLVGQTPKNEIMSNLPHKESMVASMPATVVYAVSASEMNEWRKIRKLMAGIVMIAILFLIVGGLIGIISYQKLVNVLEIGIKVRGI